jgi:Bacteriophage minor capsid protein
VSFLEDLGTYLQGEGLGTLGTDLFLGTLPLDAPNVVQQDAVTALIETSGFPAQYVHTPPGPSVEQPVVQLLRRGAPYDYAGARLQAQNQFLALGRISNQTLSGTYYFWCLPLQSVFYLRQDDFARPLMTCQFRCGKAV